MDSGFLCCVVYLCFVCVRLALLYSILPVSLDCPFLIAPSIFSNFYILMHIFRLLGIEAKLDYIKDLGFGTISLSPIFKTDATNMDFSILDHKMVSSQYGTDADLRDLIKKAHDKGISSFDDS